MQTLQMLRCSKTPSRGKATPLRSLPEQFEKPLVDELEKIIIESDEQIKRLQRYIRKLKQIDQNKEIYFKAKLKSLQQYNENLLRRLDQLEGDKRSRAVSVRQNKQPKFMFQSSCNPSASQNQENINTLNNQKILCQNSQCSQYLQQLRHQTNQIINSLDQILTSITIHNQQRQYDPMKREWLQEFQSLKRYRKTDASKSSLFLLKRVQMKIEELEMNLQEENQSKCLDDPFAQVLKGIKAKQGILSKIPFLEKINLEDMMQEYKFVVRDCQRSQNRVLQMIKSHK